MRSSIIWGFICLMTFTLLGLFQNCSAVNFTSASISQINPWKASNGGIYGGEQNFVFHHYEKDFTCEGRPQPESILLTKNKVDWVVIQNTKEKCANVDEVAVTGVTYDAILNHAQWNQVIYVAPNPYLVDASEDPNLPDLKLEDGVCEDINGKCSLLAAVQEAGYTSKTGSSAVVIPSATYLMTGPLNFTALGNPITISGSPTATIDGQQVTNLFRFTNSAGKIIFENLKFQNAGYAGSTLEGSAINGSHMYDDIAILNCQFTSSVSEYAVNMTNPNGPAVVSVKNSQFLNNVGGAQFTLYVSILIEDSQFSGSTSQYGVNINSTASAIIRRSSFDGLRSGLYMAVANSSLIEDSTFYNNGVALDYYFPQMGFSYAADIRNSTIYDNNAGTGNLGLSVMNNVPGQVVSIENSIIAQANASHSACAFPILAANVVATNSIFDDSSCIESGSGNINGDPLLGAYQNNGGPTLTLQPLPTSPAHDSGSNLVCTSTDQRGLPRPVGAACDMGAVELQ